MSSRSTTGLTKLNRVTPFAVAFCDGPLNDGRGLLGEGRSQCVDLAINLYMMGAGCSVTGARDASISMTSSWPGRAVVGPFSYSGGR